jgi:RNA polymerase sigma factor (sigma-70 family)
MYDTRDDSHEPFTPEELFDQVLPLLTPVTRAACLHCGLRPSPDNVEHFSHRLILLLMEDDYRRLRTYHHEAGLKTWLKTVANHDVSHWLARERKNITLEDAPPHTFDLMPEQEELFGLKEERCKLIKAVKQLTTEDQEWFNLLFQDEVSTEQIVQRLGCMHTTVRKRKERLIEKLKGLVNKK